MAQVTATINYFGYPRGNDNTQRFQIRRGTISLLPTNGTYPPGGIALNWTSEGNRTIPLPSATPSSTGTIFPVDVDLKSAGNTATFEGTGPGGFVYLWDNVVGNLHIFTSLEYGASGASGPLVEIGGNVPFAVFTDSIQFTAYFVRE